MSKRFIAGATCPQCQLIDKIFIYRVENIEFCECNRCGYKQQQEAVAQPAMAKIGKREHIVSLIRPKSPIN